MSAADCIRYRAELDGWFFRLLAAARAGKPFSEPKPRPPQTRAAQGER